MRYFGGMTAEQAKEEHRSAVSLLKETTTEILHFGRDLTEGERV